MKFFKLSLMAFTVSAFLLGCNDSRINDTSSANPNRPDIAQRENVSNEDPCQARENSSADSRLSVIDCDENSFFARDNLDLQAVGNLLEKANNAEDFERLLNSRNGVNNLDLNGDNYADYISVAEYENIDDNQRGFTLFDRFGADEIQEIARIIFDRSRLDATGARILLNGNEQLYGDNYNYETDWQDKVLPIASWIFNKRESNYQSPYYYDNYPNNYDAYEVVQTPVYRTRVQEYYPQQVFIKASNPTISQIKIKSPYYGKSAQKIFAKMAKPTKDQLDFMKNNPNKPDFVSIKNDKSKELRSDDKKEKNSNDFEKPGKADKNSIEIRDKSERFERENDKPNKPEKFEQEKVKRNKEDNSDRKNRGDGDKGNGKGGGKGNGKGKKD